MVTKTKRVLSPGMLLFVIYLLFSVLLESYIFFRSHGVDGAKLYLILTVFALVIIFPVPAVLRRLPSVTLSRQTLTPRMLNGWTVAFFLGALAVCAVALSGFFPGAFSYDSYEQFLQTVSGTYNDWHPVIHTLLAFTLPYKLTGAVCSIAIWQLLCFSAALAYFFRTVRKYSSGVFSLIFYCYILLSPFTLKIILFPWKDVALAICAMFIFAFVLETVFSDGAWLEKNGHLAELAVFLALGTLFRHNAILFTLPIMVFLCFYGRRKKMLVLFVFFIAVILLIRVPLYRVLAVEQPDKRVTETMGLPLNIIGNVVVEHPERLDAETRSFVYSIAPQELWNSSYIPGNFNAIKWENGCDTAIVDKMGALYTLKITWKCFLAAPDSALSGAIALTDQVFGFWHVRITTDPQIAEELHSLVAVPAGVAPISRALMEYFSVTESPALIRIFYDLGAIQAIILFVMAVQTDFRKKEELRRFHLALPLFIYNMGTMLLLTGDDIRFFYFSIPLAPAILLLFLYKPKEE